MCIKRMLVIFKPCINFKCKVDFKLDLSITSFDSDQRTSIKRQQQCLNHLIRCVIMLRYGPLNIRSKTITSENYSDTCTIDH